MEPNNLVLESVIGFSGSAPASLIVMPDRETMVYPQGCTVVVERIAGKKQQQFLQGHNDRITCIAVSPSGKYIASGQQTHQTLKADVIVWDAKACKEIFRFSLHQGRIQAVCFSPSERFVLTLGGQDDGMIVVWDMTTGQAVCGGKTGSQAAGAALTAAYSKTNDNTFITAGEDTLRVWDMDPESRKLQPTEVAVRSLRRVFTCLQVSEDDSMAYCGTTTGDIIQFSLPNKVLKSTGPLKDKFKSGVQSMALLKNGDLLVGAGDGTIALVKPGSWKAERSQIVDGGVTSVALRGDGHEFFIGTDRSNVYRFSLVDFKFEARSICHSQCINDVAFPHGASELFATCSKGEIRVWQTLVNRELLRISVPNKECFCVAFKPDGKVILSGWDDGVVRAFLPESGKLLFEITNAHNKGVTSLAFTNQADRAITGGGDGQVRVWQLGKQTQTLVATMKEHKGRVNDIIVRKNDKECVSASADGTCILWDLTRFARNQIVFASTEFTRVRFRSDESQMITVGADRKLAYWECFDGSPIREMEIARAGTISALDISPDGHYLVTGGKDRVLKVFSYEEADLEFTGQGHSGDITALKICPHSRFVVSTGSDGAIYTWAFPCHE